MNLIRSHLPMNKSHIRQISILISTGKFLDENKHSICLRNIMVLGFTFINKDVYMHLYILGLGCNVTYRL